MKLFVETGPGLEPALVAEAKALGWTANVAPGGALIDGVERDAFLDANLKLRAANRVLLILGERETTDARGLVRSLEQLQLERYCARDASVALKFSGAEGAPGLHEFIGGLSRLLPTRERILPFSEEDESPRLALFIQVRRSKGGWQLSVMVDTSGAPLFRRGYRQEVSRAPMRETLAAGLLLLAGYDGQTPFFDPMCGSGSLLIEAAMMAARKAPGSLGRTFAFEQFPSFDAAEWQRRLGAAQANERRIDVPIWGNDLNAGSLGTARRNAKRAGVFEALTLTRLDALTLRADAGPAGAASGRGLVVTNPPYGKRVGEKHELSGLFQGLGAQLRGPFAKWSSGVLIPEKGLESVFGVAPGAQRFSVSNGGIPLSYVVSPAASP